MKRNTTICYDCQCGQEIVLRVEGYPDDPGRMWGPPENCHPPEDGEMTILEGDPCKHCGAEVDYEKVREKFQGTLEPPEEE